VLGRSRSWQSHSSSNSSSTFISAVLWLCNRQLCSRLLCSRQYFNSSSSRTCSSSGRQQKLRQLLLCQQGQQECRWTDVILPVMAPPGSQEAMALQAGLTLFSMLLHGCMLTLHVAA